MALNLNEARKHVLDLGQPNQKLYWFDFLLSYAIGIATFILAYPHSISEFAFWGWATLSSLAFYRAIGFIHELAHFKQRLKSFRILWNALAGVPLAFPAFMYARSHAIHHNPKTYGTKEDGEYISFQSRSRWEIVAYLASSFWTAPALVFRFAVLFPPSLAIPALRKFIVERGSSIVIALDYVGHWPSESEKKEWWIMETACCLFWIGVLSFVFVGWIPGRILAMAYGIMSGALFLNNMRTLAAHRFANDGRILSIEEQLLDSVNLVNHFPGWVFSALAAPVGLRYHALHHLFPFLPYHSLGEAHRRLSSRLAKESAYHRVSERGVFVAVWKLWRREAPLVSTSSAIKA
jgi:fatty acid desaturase